MTTPLSTRPTLRYISSALGTISLAFGINAFFRPAAALEPFALSYTPNPVTDVMIMVYGARDIFWGCAIYATAYHGSHKALGWIMLAGSAVAFTDGWICMKVVGDGMWNHWSYGPVLTVVGALLLGAAD